MIRFLPGKTAEMPREKLFWAVVAVLVVGQLLAFWLLCSGQVRRAEVHDATLQLQRVAVADCLRYIPRATLRGCEKRVDPHSRADWWVAGDKAAGATAVSSATEAAAPVRVAYH